MSISMLRWIQLFGLHISAKSQFDLTVARAHHNPFASDYSLPTDRLDDKSCVAHLTPATLY